MANLVICDDESHITDILVRFFKEKGHEVIGATRAEDALAPVLAGKVDLVITDLTMKGLSGFDLLGRIKEAGVVTPVIVTTGNPSHHSAVQALRGGAFDYVVKPFHLEEILERAERALLTKRIHEENLLYSKLVSLHAISKSLTESDSLDALAARVVQLGARLSQSDAGWYLSQPQSEPPKSEVPGGPHPGLTLLPSDPVSGKSRAYLQELAAHTLSHGDVQVTEAPPIPSEDGPSRDGWFLTLPVEILGSVQGVLVFKRGEAAGKYDAVDLEVMNQLGSTFALSIRALGLTGAAASPPPSSLSVPRDKLMTSTPSSGAIPLPASPSGTFPGHPASASAAPPSIAAAWAWARLVSRLVDEHCIGYQSKSQRVLELGQALFTQMRWPPILAKEWALVSQVYDIAKIRMRQSVLIKSSALTAAERDLVRSQSAWVAECVAEIPGLESLGRILEAWQERFDGTGKPRGAKGTEIPPLARLLSVIDSYVALLSKRPYRQAYGETQALDLVRLESGKGLDPDIVSALVKLKSGGSG